MSLVPAVFRTNPRSALLGTVITSTLLAGCATQQPAQQAEAAERGAPQPATTTPQANPQLAIRVGSGTYRCDQNVRVEIKPDSRDVNRIDLGWKGKNYTLTRHNSYSGLPRYEDQTSQLVWVVLPWKGLLLDGHSGQPLANECKLS